MIGVYAVALGILCVAASFRLPLDGRDTALMILTGLVAIVFGIVIFAKPGAGALAVLALIAAFALVTGISELVVAIGGEKLLERKVKTFAPPSESLRTTPSRRTDGRSARPHVLGAGDELAGSVSLAAGVDGLAPAWHRPPPRCVADNPKGDRDDYDSN